MSYRNLADVLQELSEGLLVIGMVPTALMDFVDETNVDTVIAGLPAEHRAFLLTWARDVIYAPKADLIQIAGVSNLRDIRPEDSQDDRSEIFFSALRGWFARHP